MKRLYGNMWTTYGNDEVFCITGNSYLKSNSTVVMGRGIAKIARDRITGIDLFFGLHIDRACGHLGNYAIVGNIRHVGLQSILLFQVKYNYADPALTELIADSTVALSRMAHRYSDRTFNLNFPGIGNGRLSYNDVLPIVQRLPDNVNVWTFD